MFYFELSISFGYFAFNSRLRTRIELRFSTFGRGFIATFYPSGFLPVVPYLRNWDALKMRRSSCKVCQFDFSNASCSYFVNEAFPGKFIMMEIIELRMTFVNISLPLRFASIERSIWEVFIEYGWFAGNLYLHIVRSKKKFHSNWNHLKYFYDFAANS